MRVLRTRGVPHACECSLSLSLFLLRFFSLPPTRLLARAHTDTLLAVLVQSKRIHGTFRASLFFNLSFLSLFFSLSFSSSHLTLYSPLVSLTYCRIRSVPRTQFRTSQPSLAPSSLSCTYHRPWSSCVHAHLLSASIASVHTRALPLFVARANTDTARARARERT